MYVFFKIFFPTLLTFNDGPAVAFCPLSHRIVTPPVAQDNNGLFSSKKRNNNNCAVFAHAVIYEKNALYQYDL